MKERKQNNHGDGAVMNLETSSGLNTVVNDH